jgi:hypothetical protein
VTGKSEQVQVANPLLPMHPYELYKHMNELNNIWMGRRALKGGSIKFVYGQELTFRRNNVGCYLNV